MIHSHNILEMVNEHNLGTARLRVDRLILKLWAANGHVDLNRAYASVAVPENLTIFDEDGNAITGDVSFASIRQNYFIERDGVRYHFLEPIYRGREMEEEQHTEAEAWEDWQQLRLTVVSGYSE